MINLELNLEVYHTFQECWHSLKDNKTCLGYKFQSESNEA